MKKVRKTRNFFWIQADKKTGEILADVEGVPYTYPTKNACMDDIFPGNYSVRVGLIAAPFAKRN